MLAETLSADILHVQCLLMLTTSWYKTLQRIIFEYECIETFSENSACTASVHVRHSDRGSRIGYLHVIKWLGISVTCVNDSFFVR